MKFDLKSLTRRDLEKLRGDVDKALVKIAATEKKLALAAAEKVAKAHGYTLKELAGGAPKPAAAKPARAKRAKSDGRAKVAPKFRNPANAKETWSGRGRPPKWMADHIAGGGAKDDLAI